MTNNGIYYNPEPPRVWYRVQNACSTNQNNTNIQNDKVYFPLTQKYMSPLEAQLQEQMLLKGNILQYKKNSVNFTKKQKYSQFSRGCGNSRKKSYASQSITSSNPNTSSLQRVNYTNIPYPNTIIGSPNNPSGPYQANVPNQSNCPSNVLQDGGNLVCGVLVNPCTQEIITPYTPNTLCYPTTSSNVPGPPIFLCWYSNIQTWYPRQRYTMNNSLDKWPQGYKGFTSAVTLAPPVLSAQENINGVQVVLSWSVTQNACLPISNYNVYQNNILIDTVSYDITSININNLTPSQSYSFYIVASSGTVNSLPSNVVLVNVAS